MPSYTILTEQLDLLMEHLATRSKDMPAEEVGAILSAIENIRRFISA